MKAIEGITGRKVYAIQGDQYVNRDLRSIEVREVDER